MPDDLGQFTCPVDITKLDADGLEAYAREMQARAEAMQRAAS